MTDIVAKLIKLQTAKENKEKADRELAQAQKDWTDAFGPPPLPVISRRV